TLTATVAPANATNKKVTWSSNKTDVATVDENGTVTAVGVGEATITVTTEDGGKTAACTVKVNAKPDTPTAVTGVTLDKTTLTFTIGDVAQTLTATVAPANATNKKVTWTSSNAKVATVADGKVTAVGVGEATITVTTEDGGHKAACRVKVKAKTADTPKPTPEAVEDVILARLEVSPNPFTTQLRIVNPEGIAVSYELVNLTGLVLRRGVLAGSDTMVDTTDLPTGLYFVRLTGENGAKRVLRVFHY
ncbi:MAG: Ig-like domain-containing protein, partial [Bacteroides sp.]